MAKSPLSSLAGIGSFGSILNVLREVDVRPAREAAETPFVIAFASRDVPFAEYLAALMYRGDRPADVPPYRAAVGLPLNAAAQISRANLVVIITRSGQETDEEMQMKRTLEASNVPLLMCFLEEVGSLPPARQDVAPANAITLPLTNGTLDEPAAVKRLTNAIRQLKAVDDLTLARFLPAFREPVVRALIEEVAVANATYSLGTGLLQINPVTGVPIAVADTVILTKNQGVMAYKIALAMGMPPDFKAVMPQLAGVIGGGLVLRQVARGLISLIPGFGVLPKVAISFAGTFAIGEAVYLWCKSGEKVTEEGLQAIYALALQRGNEIANRLSQRRVGRRVNRSTRSTARNAQTAEPSVEPMREEQSNVDAQGSTIELPPASPKRNDVPPTSGSGLSS